MELKLSAISVTALKTKCSNSFNQNAAISAKFTNILIDLFLMVHLLQYHAVATEFLAVLLLCRMSE